MAIWLPDLDGRSGPKYLRIVEAMAEDIAAGRLTPGDRLPPHRELAYRLGVSANTTGRAYAEAVRRALLRGEVGRGTFVRPLEVPAPGEAPNSLHRAAAGPVDLSRNLPFPGLAEAPLRRVLGALSEGAGLAALLDYQTAADLTPHGEAGRIWLAECGVDLPAERVVATMGAQHGLLCVLTALLRPGDLLLTEALTYMPVCAMAGRLGLHMAQVAMDAGGVCPESFEALCRTAKPRAFYLTPTLQAPTTVTLSEGRRQAIAEIAARHGVILIEDDVFAPLAADRSAALAARAPDHTIYVSSLSKAIAPGLRVGFLGAPERLAPALRHAVNLSVWMAPPLTLEIAARLIADGSAAELAAGQRRLAARRRSLAEAVLGGAVQGRAVQGRAGDGSARGGLHLWLPLPEGVRADLFRAQCAEQGVLVSEARSFAPGVSVGGAPGTSGEAGVGPGFGAAGVPEAIRICLSHEPEEARLILGLERIAELLRAPPSRFALTL